MKIQMIRDCGAFKKGEIHNVSPKKAMTLLTNGVCINVKDEKVSPEKMNATEKKITKKHSEKPPKEKQDVI